MKKITSLLLITALCIVGYGQITLQNPSFEGPNGEGVAPGWSSCGSPPGYSVTSPDILPMSPQYPNKVALDKSTYLGIQAYPDNGYYETVSQKLSTNLKAGVEYSISLWLTRVGNKFPSTFDPTKNWLYGASDGCYGGLQIWGGSSMCKKAQLLWESPKIYHEKWQKYSPTFTPTSNWSHITLTPYYKKNTCAPDPEVGWVQVGVGVDGMTAITESCAMTVDAGIDIMVPCFNPKTTLTANVSGGSNLSYSWSTGATTQNITVGPGVYSVTASAGGCSATDDVVVSLADGPVADFGALEKCIGQRSRMNGSISTGNIVNWEWNLGDGATLKDTSQAFHYYSNPGSYKVKLTVTDDQGCKSNIEKAVLVNDTPAVAIKDIKGAFCGGSLGEATAEVSGGSAPYTFKWSDGQAAATAEALAGGKYQVTVTDSKGCATMKEVVIPGSSGIGGKIEKDSVSCTGGSDGSLTALPKGGTPPYLYYWTDSSNIASYTQTISNLPAGEYYITVTDSTGCKVTATTHVYEPKPLILGLSFANTTCKGVNDGYVQASVSGGTGDYYVVWSTGDTASYLDSIGPGNYYATAYDKNGCPASRLFEVFEASDSLKGVQHVLSNADCGGGQNGAAEVKITGGVPPYSYQWNDINGQDSSFASGLKAGKFEVKVVDNFGCEIIVPVIINSQGDLNVEVVEETKIGCDRLSVSTGSAYVKITGGKEPFTYKWSTGATTDSITGLAPGTYTVEVTDAANCVALSEVIMQEVVQLEISGVSPTCNNCSDGSLTVDVVKGASPFTYRWDDNDQQTTKTATGLTVGVYTVTVTDANGCRNKITDTLNTAVSINEYSMLNDVFIYPNPADQILNISIPDGLEKPGIRIYNMDGRLLYVSDQLIDSQSSTLYIDFLPNGLYLIRLNAADQAITKKISVFR